MRAWVEDRMPASLPTERFVVQPGWRLEVIPLSFGRARITHTDGLFVDTFW